MSATRSVSDGPRRSRARVVAAAGAGVLALSAVVGGGPAAAEPVLQPGGRAVPAAAWPGAGPWRVLAPPVPTDRRSSLVDADPVGTSSAWAAGWVAASAGDGDFPRQPLVVRLVGDRWVSTGLTDVDAGGEYERGVAAAGPSEAWLAGMDGNGIVTRRWNGTTWTRVPFGLTADEGGWLESGRVAAVPGRAYLITTGIFDGYSHSRVATWTGSAWTWLPDVTETYGDLYDIDAAGRDAVWVVGGSFEKGFALQWNGTRWVDRLPGRADLNLLRLHVASRNSVWVYGERTGGPEVENVLLHWNGTRWTEQVVPDGVVSGGVTATSDGAAWVVARGDVPDRTRYLRFGSGGFRAVDGPARTNAFGVSVGDLVTLPGRGEPLMVGQASVLGAPAAAASEARRAGAAGAATVPGTPAPAPSAAASEWTRVQPPAGIRPLATLNGVAAGSATRAWAVGQEYAGSYASQIPGVPLVLQLDGTAWTRTALRGVTWKGSLTSVAATSPSDAWAAGVDTANGPRLLHFDGTAWQPADPPVTGTVSSLRVVASPGHQPWLFVTPTTGNPVVLQRTGGAWQSVELPPAPFTPAAVHVAVGGTVWLAGYRLQQIPGFPLSVPILVVQRRSGTGWVALPEGPQVSPRDVLAATDGTLWVAGGVPRTGPGGPIGTPPPSALVHWDGTAWSQASLPSTFGIPALAGDDAGRPQWASGTGALVGGQQVGGYLKYAGGTWTRVPGAPVLAPELDRVSIAGLAHLPGTASTLAVGQAPYPFEEQRVPRIEREDAP